MAGDTALSVLLILSNLWVVDQGKDLKGKDYDDIGCAGWVFKKFGNVPETPAEHGKPDEDNGTCKQGRDIAGKCFQSVIFLIGLLQKV